MRLLFLGGGCCWGCWVGVAAGGGVGVAAGGGGVLLAVSVMAGSLPSSMVTARSETEQGMVSLDQLELQLTLQPEVPAHWLDLAVAWLRLGKPQVTLELLQQLEQQFELPPRIRQVVDFYRTAAKSLPQQGGVEWLQQLHFDLELRQGYRDNINLGPQQATTELQLGDVVTQLSLADEALPLGDHYRQLRATLPFDRLLPLRLKVHYRDYLQQSRFDERIASVALRLSPQPGTLLELEQSLVHHQSDIDSSWRRLMVRQILPGGTTVMEGVVARVASPRQEPPSTQLRIGLHGSYGEFGVRFNHRPEARAGGHQRGFYLATRQQQALGTGGGRLRWSASYSLLQDDAPYSRTFWGETRRRRQLLSLDLNYIHPLGPQLDLLFSLEHQRQDDTVPLFETRNSEASIALQWRL